MKRCFLKVSKVECVAVKRSPYLFIFCRYILLILVLLRGAFQLYECARTHQSARINKQTNKQKGQQQQNQQANKKKHFFP